jgi:hypothetical protein
MLTYCSRKPSLYVRTSSPKHKRARPIRVKRWGLILPSFANMKKVIFIKFPIALNLVYGVGDIAELESKQADILIQEGYCEEVKEAKKKKTINPEFD